MSYKDFTWSHSEKKIARAAFDAAYESEMTSLKMILREKVSQLSKNEQVWELHNYLTDRRKWVDKKYDYRYSQLIRVFGILLSEGYLSLDLLTGLNEDKIDAIKLYAQYYRETT